MSTSDAQELATAAAAPAPPVLNLAPSKKTDTDLFAPAPQVKKMSRKDKQRLAVAAAMGADAAKKGQPQRALSGGAETGSGIFATVFADAAAVEGVAGADDAANATDAKSRRSGRKKPKKQVLRHALHKNEEEDIRTVFVGNLPNTVDKKQVAKAFKDCGAIESVRVRSQALESAPVKKGSSQASSSADAGGGGENVPGERATLVMGKKDVGRAVRVLRGEIKKDPRYSATAYVLFQDAASVAVAVEKKNGVVFQNRHLVVTALDATSAAYAPETSVFLGNVAFNTTEEDVWKYFAEHGVHDVRRVRLVRDRDSGECKGFGYVEFHTKSSVEPAIATRGSQLNGRELRIVHVNKSKDVKAVTASRREKRERSASLSTSSSRVQPSRESASPVRARGRQESSRPAEATRASAQPAWMGLTTNPRRKIPRDLRSLAETNAERKFKGPRPVVKRKMRNPEK